MVCNVQNRVFVGLVVAVLGLVFVFYTQSHHLQILRDTAARQEAPLLKQDTVWNAQFGNENQPCNLTRYKQDLSLTSDNPRIPREYLAGCHHVIYNNVPKTGSRTNKDILQSISKRNGFTAYTVRTPFKIGLEKQEKYLEDMAAAQDGRFVFMGHFDFVDWSQFVPDVVFVNLIRDPVEFFTSVYYFHKFGDESSPREGPKSDAFSTTISDCIRQDACFYRVTGEYNHWRFLAPHDVFKSCKSGADDCIPRTMENIEKHHVVVGVYEEMEGFHEVLEFLLPHLYRDVSAQYAKRGEALRAKTRTASHDALSSADSDLLRRRLQRECEFYNVIKYNFHRLLRAVRKIAKET